MARALGQRQSRLGLFGTPLYLVGDRLQKRGVGIVPCGGGGGSEGEVGKRADTQLPRGRQTRGIRPGGEKSLVLMLASSKYKFSFTTKTGHEAQH